MIKVSFDGKHGAYSEQAITSLLDQQNIKDFQIVRAGLFLMPSNVNQIL